MRFENLKLLQLKIILEIRIHVGNLFIQCIIIYIIHFYNSNCKVVVTNELMLVSLIERKSHRENLGIYVPAPPFNYGQLYVAPNRTKREDILKIIVEKISSQELLITYSYFTKKW